MDGLELLVLMTRSNIVGLLQGLLRFDGHFFKTKHGSSLLDKKGLAISPAPIHSTTAIPVLLGRRSRRNRRGGDVHLDLLRLRFFALRNAQAQDAILVVGLDRLRIHGVR